MRSIVSLMLMELNLIHIDTPPPTCLSLSGARTYSYLFNMKTRIPLLPRWVEAEHAEDLQYLFGKPFSMSLIYFPRHRDLSKYMIAYWTNFARTG